MQADPYEYVSKDNIVTYSYMKDYAEPMQEIDGNGNLNRKTAPTVWERFLNILGKLRQGK